MTARLFLDSSVYIAAAEGAEPEHADALALLFGDVSIVTTRLVRIEVLPAPPGSGHARQQKARAAFLALADEWVGVDGALFDAGEALRLQVAGLGALDALHAAAAMRAGADLVTVERTTRPLYRVPGLKVMHVTAAARALQRSGG